MEAGKPPKPSRLKDIPPDHPTTPWAEWIAKCHAMKRWPREAEQVPKEPEGAAVPPSWALTKAERLSLGLEQDKPKKGRRKG